MERAKESNLSFAGLSRGDALAKLREALQRAGLDTPALEARILVTQALAIDPVALVTGPEAVVEAAGGARLAEFAARRLAREPVARILGEREFWGLPFGLSPATLVPRPDTETVVRAALAWAAQRSAALRILDLGTGTGCLLVALLYERPDASGLGVDLAPDALRMARRNAERNGVASRAAFVASDWGAAIEGRFDLIVSNPPYVASGDIAGLAPEVRAHDPSLALDGGKDGLSAYRTIFSEASRLLALGGTLVVEFGMGQEEGLRAAARAGGLAVASVEADLEGRPRAALLRAR